jgi:hypothetical protein
VDLKAMGEALKKVFDAQKAEVKRTREGKVVATVHMWSSGLAFTFAQMEQLPAIFGTTKLDFSRDEHCSFGGSEVTPADYDDLLVIEASCEGG